MCLREEISMMMSYLLHIKYDYVFMSNIHSCMFSHRCDMEQQIVFRNEASSVFV
ncbi:unnamed protein product, partial [Schistosoma rodhaini]|uniref:Uncharacterized protein n=1 Tax=Schistosoma rodhaini TaxID=6188 RepID=A0AA85GMD6_9TREM